MTCVVTCNANQSQCRGDGTQVGLDVNTGYSIDDSIMRFKHIIINMDTVINYQERLN